MKRYSFFFSPSQPCISLPPLSPLASSSNFNWIWLLTMKNKMIRRCHNFHTILNAQSHIKSYQKTNLFVYICDLSLRLIEIRNGAEVSCGHASSNVTESLKVSQKKDRLITWQYRVSWQYNHKQHSIVVLFTRTFTQLGVLGPVLKKKWFFFFLLSFSTMYFPSLHFPAAHEF